MIGDDIEVTIVDIRGDKVRLGINAPKSMSVHRKEVYQAIQRENHSAASVTNDKPEAPSVPETAAPERASDDAEAARDAMYRRHGIIID